MQSKPSVWCANPPNCLPRPQGMLALHDALVALFEDNEVVAVKHHPLLAEWAPYVDGVFEPLIRRHERLFSPP